ncbi:MAG: FIST N-terminal domain-containing protein [Patescibacteria group bacterium]|nr:FIST N-terminal domain-containing protein [Patescibacteria group bacterium]
MSIQAGAGYSQNTKNSQAAGAEAIQKALLTAGNEAIKLITVFTTEQYDEAAVIKGIQSVVGETPLIGCTAASVIINGKTFTDAVAVSVLRSDTLNIALSLSENISGQSKEAGRNLAINLSKQIKDEDNSQNVILMLLDASKTTGIVSDVIDGAYEILGASYRFIGGGSSDNLHFKKSFQFLNGKIYQDAVVAACLTTTTSQTISLKHGWTPTSINMIVTKVDGKVIKEIDGSPALKIYMEALNQDVASFNFDNFYNFASAHPLGLPTSRGEYIIRDPFSASTTDNSITFVSEVPENSIVRIMKGTPETLLEASATAATQVKDNLGEQQPALIFIADCVSRLLFLGNHTADELSNISSIGENVPMIGFFSLGEIGIEKGGAPAFYNKTCALYVIAK